MLFETYGSKFSPAILFFHAMGVTGKSSERAAEYLNDKYYCILPTSPFTASVRNILIKKMR